MNSQLLVQRAARRRVGGFNLIELLIVVAIVAILAAIGFPAYQNYARDAKRSDAHEALSRASQLQERFFADTSAYATNMAALGYTATAGVFESPQGYWGLVVTGVSATGYTVVASPTGTHADGDCATISMNAQGVRGSAPGTADECW